MKTSLPWLLLAGLANAKRPNILFILTDDQDLHMESVEHMPFLKSDIVEKGTTFAQHYCTVALCCPSRATLWTGKAAHNHNITNVSPPHGGYPKVAETGLNDDYLFLWMQDAGYNTYYTGKLWNFHGVSNYDRPFARGFNSSDFLLDPYTYRYWDTMMTRNGEPPVSYAGKYNTDVVAEKARGLLHEALRHEEPWFLTVAPIAPHSNWVFDERTNTTYLSTPQSAYRHEHLFHDYKIPRGRSFNEPMRGAAGWPGRLEALNESVLAYNDHYQRQRLRALQAVDEMVHELVKKVEDAGEIENTFIFYSTDNGYHISQHRMHPGKECGYDTDIHIPMFVRGPGLEAGGQVDTVTSHTDIAPTILQLAGVEKLLDGEAMPWKDSNVGGKTEHAAIEFWGWGAPEGHYGLRSDEHFESGKLEGLYLNNTYKGLRMVGEGFSLYYSVWCTGERELYNLQVRYHLTSCSFSANYILSQTDPEQTSNVLVNTSGEVAVSNQFNVFGREVDDLVHRLDALIMALKDCKGRACSRPWLTLHPGEEVSSLRGALDPKFDKFYQSQPKMYFDSCEAAFIKEKESNEPVNQYRGTDDQRLTYDYGDEWILAV
ncbi:arylsulfatase [Colletotrichum plurivorum]|uniref:Arylsulfatase n=1 Tax=Colletotrichum plurivorum TaxID=2175906 RepID=A0A8H6NA88_9PEZI|nr:arylsulfatase [Colletotrichum plurivorum]